MNRVQLLTQSKDSLVGAGDDAPDAHDEFRRKLDKHDATAGGPERPPRHALLLTPAAPHSIGLQPTVDD